MASEVTKYKLMTHGTMNGSQNGETNGELHEYLEKRSDLHDRMAKDPSGRSVIEWYNGEATLYDGQFDHANFIYHKDVAAGIARVVPDRDAAILDLAAGSGKIGVELKTHGFKNIDSLDGAENMLKLAEEKGIYKKYIHCMVGTEKILQLDDASYDAVCCGGSIAKGHLRYDTIGTILRLVKPGGYLVFSCAEWNFQFPDFSRVNLERCFEDLRVRGLCSRVEENQSYHIGEEVGYIFTLRRGDVVLNGT